MSVARDVVTEAPASFTTGTSFTHPASGTPKGVLAFVAQDASSTDENGSISYGGVALTKQAFAHDTATELLGAYVYFLGSGIPTGTQTVSFSGWGSSTKIAWVYTLTAAADTAVEATGIAQENQADPAITLTTGAGVETYVAGMLASGLGTVGALTAGANGTSRGNFDFGQQVAVTGDRDTNATGGSVVYDWSSGAASDDVAMVAIAIKESGGGSSPQNVSATGLASAGSFGTLTVQPGAITATLSALASAAALGFPSAVPGVVTTSPASLASAGAFGAPSAQPGAVLVSVSALDSAGSFGTPGASTGSGTQLVVVSALTTAADFGALSALPGAITQSVSGLASAGAFGSPIPEPGATVIVVTGLDSAAAIGALTTEEQINVLVSALASAGAFGAPTTAVGPTTIAVAGLGSAAQFGAFTLDGGVAPTFSPAIHGGRFYR